MGNFFSCIEKEGWDSHHHVHNAYKQLLLPQQQDMSRPLSHYFISSGHNSYLQGNQLTSSAGTRTIETGLRNGCRVIELDVYDGPSSEPVCTHGGTLTSSVKFKDCLLVIEKCGFTASPYPVILTLENHTGAEQQAVMAQQLQQVFGSHLFIPAPDQLATDGRWLSPEALKNKVIIRTKVKPTTVPQLARLVYICNSSITGYDVAAGPAAPSSHSVPDSKLPQVPEYDQQRSKLFGLVEQKDIKESITNIKDSLTSALKLGSSGGGGGGAPGAAAAAAPATQPPASDDGPFIADVPAGDDARRHKQEEKREQQQRVSPGMAAQELELAAQQDDTLPHSFGGSAAAHAGNGQAQPDDDAAAAHAAAAANESSSLPAGLKSAPLAAVLSYSAKHLLRCYPSGMRMIDNSNYNPTLPWSLGVSLAALNVQLWDEAIWINQSFFSQQNFSGYVLKPDWMTTAIPPSGLPPRSPRTLAVTVYSAHKFQGKRMSVYKDDPYVELQVVGLPCDVSSHQTEHRMDTGRLVVDRTFSMPVSYPELGVLLLLLKDYDVAGKDTVLGYAGIPLATLAPGEYKLRLTRPYEMHVGSRGEGALMWIKVKLEWQEGQPTAAGGGGGAAVMQ